ncbi:MAG: hypothetical protein ACYTEK_25110 [Planctomycetota bacterium]|jgi:hypothetical protein
MGRWYDNKKATVEEACDLTVFQLKEYGMLEGGRHTATVITWVMKRTGKESSISLEVNMTGEPYARLAYALSDREGNVTPYDSKVDLVTTPCNFGGVRYWFACPWCGNRVGGVYLAPGDRYFRCRHCNNLTYNSRNRCVVAAFGHTSRQIKKLRPEIKRWTWRGRPTRKARRLYALQHKMSLLCVQAAAQLEKLRARLS